MKLFIFSLTFFIISCGKNETPPFQEFTKFEHEIDATIKNKPHMPSNIKSDDITTGKLYVTSIDTKVNYGPIPFSGQLDLKKLGLNLIVSNPNSSLNRNLNLYLDRIFIHQWPKIIPFHKKEQFHFTFYPGKTNEKKFLYLIKSDGIQKAEKISNAYQLLISGDDLEKILNFENEISYSSQGPDLLSNSKKYFVIIYDGERQEIKYFKDRESLDFFVENHHFNQAQLIQNHNLFSPEFLVDEKSWFTSLTPENYKIFYKTNLKDLKAHYLSHLLKSQSKLTRSKGKSLKVLSFKKSKNALFYLALKGERQDLRTKEYTTKQIFHGVQSFGNRPNPAIANECLQFHRKVVSQKVSKLNHNEIHKLVNIQSGNDFYTLDDALFVNEEKIGAEVIYQFGFKIPGENIKIFLKNLSSSNKIPVGFYKQECINNSFKKKIKKLDFSHQFLEHTLTIDITSHLENFKE